MVEVAILSLNVLWPRYINEKSMRCEAVVSSSCDEGGYRQRECLESGATTGGIVVILVVTGQRA